MKRPIFKMNVYIYTRNRSSSSCLLKADFEGRKTKLYVIGELKREIDKIIRKLRHGCTRH